MEDLYAWRFGDSSDQMIFYADNREVASVNWRSNSRWEGWITGGDEAVTLTKRSGLQNNQRAASPPRPRFGASGAASSEVAPCKQYYGTRRCAQAQDVGDPTSGALQPVANMNVRFLGARTSSVVGQLPRGRCVATQRCSSSILSGEIWCQIKLTDIKTGWVLKEDKKSVYAKNGCG